MNKTSVVVSCPIDTYSGYGARARDFVKALIALEKYDVKLLSQRWGNTRFGYLADHGEDDLASRIIPNLTSKPDVWIQSTVPNEFQAVGTFNIGLTAGMETTQVDSTWLEGCNRMDLVITSAKHGKTVFEQTSYNIQDKNTGQVVNTLKLEKPVEILFEGADLNKYYKKDSSGFDLSSIKEDFCYLSVGHWMQGDFGEDRKNIGYTIKSFYEAFKNKPKQPALVLKTQQVGTSIMDRESILDRIDAIRSSVKGKLPNVYLIHGEVTDEEINDLYNHSKIKVLVSHTKGEGFGRPLLEFSLTGKPIIASGWSAHTDFLSKEFTILLGGTLNNVHKSAAQKNMILEDAKWFRPDDIEVSKAYKESFKSYKKYLTLAKRQGHISKTQFSFDKMVEKLDSILTKHIPDFPKQISLNLPKLNLPKLEKIDG